MASIYLPPIARKKKVDGWPRSDTSRVFADFNEETLTTRTSYSSHFVRHNVPPSPQRTMSAGRKNKPQPTAVSFLRQNPRFVCEPICHVETAVNNPAEVPHPWWPNEFLEKEVKQPHHSMDSTSRSDYMYIQPTNLEQKFTRFSCNPNKSKAVTGIVPECDTSKPLLGSQTNRKQEKISYEHQYNSRLDPNEPVRGRRHGCFVWRPVVRPRRRSSMHRQSEGGALQVDASPEASGMQEPKLQHESVIDGSSNNQLEAQPIELTDEVQGADVFPQGKADEANDPVLSSPPKVV